jgi:hypothetical protein
VRVSPRAPRHLVSMRRNRRWTTPSAELGTPRDFCAQTRNLVRQRAAAAADVSPFPEILRAQRRHLALLRQQHWLHAEDAISHATHAIHRAFTAGAWTSHQLQRLRQLDPGTGVRRRPPAGDTAALATRPSRSRSTPTSSGSPHVASGRTTPPAARHREHPDSRPAARGALQPKTAVRASERMTTGRRSAAAAKERRMR